MYKQIAHIAFTVKNMETTIGFYAKLLGTKHLFSLANPAGEPWIEYLKGIDGQYIELFYGGERARVLTDRSICFMHVDYLVDDLDKAHANALELGAEIVEYLPQKHLIVRDCDNNTLKLIS
ncbi:MAG: VOC family protein [Acetanaerobacterium sp.]